jgi:hypothetical protein
MKNLRSRESQSAILIPGIFFLLMLFGFGPGVAQGVEHPTISGLSQEEALRLGEKMYREGVLPSGEPMEAVVKGDIPVVGTAFSCVSCHLNSGLGSFEGLVATPPTTWRKLSKPFETALYRGIIPENPITLRRPAYTDESLAEAIRGGVDPAGRVLNDVMPRYMLDDKNMAILIFYLKHLSSQFSPGVSDTTVHFATVVSEDVSREVRDATVAPLMKYVTYWNSSADFRKTAEKIDRAAAASSVPQDRFASSGSYERHKIVPPAEAELALQRYAGPEQAYRNISLSVWVLKGAPETWRSQLEEYYRKDPVFGLLGGVTATGEWKPIHDFCEANRIPELFPITEFPVISEKDWYTLYLSRGYYQEGEGAARYLHTMDEAVKDGAILQIVRDSREGRSLAQGFQVTWADLGHKEPPTVALKAGETLTADFIEKALTDKKPAYIVLWDGPEVLPALETLAAAKNRPGMVIVSSGYLGKSMWRLDEKVRDFTYITYPLQQRQVQIYAIAQVLDGALTEMKGNYYRDYFLDVIDMMQDQDVRPYARLSFGPGQRYASKGCYIVQLTKGPNPQLVRKSDWVIY